MSPYARNVNILQLHIRESETENSTYFVGGGGAPLEVKAPQQVSLLTLSHKKEVIKDGRMWRYQQCVYISRFCFELTTIQISLQSVVHSHSFLRS
jgi:hypothetical protein